MTACCLSTLRDYREQTVVLRCPIPGSSQGQVPRVNAYTNTHRPQSPSPPQCTVKATQLPQKATGLYKVPGPLHPLCQTSLSFQEHPPQHPVPSARHWLLGQGGRAQKPCGHLKQAVPCQGQVGEASLAPLGPEEKGTSGLHPGTAHRSIQSFQ